MKDRYSKYKNTGIKWLGEIPENWESIRLGMIGVFTSSGIDKKIIEGEPLVKMVNYTDIIKNRTHNPVITNEIDFMVVSSPISKIKEHKLKKGDLVFIPSSETDEDLGVSSLIDIDEEIVYSYHIIRFQFTKEVNHYFKKYLGNHYGVLKQFSQEGKGTTRQIIGSNVFRNIIVVLPPLSEQEKIVKYLDEKTTQIDSLISITEKKIELLKQKKTSIINKLVTKGLDNNVELKESGVNWIGKIPKHWEIKKLKYFAKICNGSDFKDFEVEEGGYPVFGTGGIFSRSSRFLYDKTSVLLGRKGSINKPQIVTEPFWTSDTTYYTEIKENVNPYYFFHLVNQIQFDLYVYGSAIPSMTKSVYEDMLFPFPPVSEQELIVEYLDKHIGDIDKLVSIEQRRIETLKEYRQSLISEVVTGKVKVTD